MVDAAEFNKRLALYRGWIDRWKVYLAKYDLPDELQQALRDDIRDLDIWINAILDCRETLTVKPTLPKPKETRRRGHKPKGE